MALLSCLRREGIHWSLLPSLSLVLSTFVGGGLIGPTTDQDSPLGKSSSAPNRGLRKPWALRPHLTSHPTDSAQCTLSPTPPTISQALSHTVLDPALAHGALTSEESSQLPDSP